MMLCPFCMRKENTVRKHDERNYQTTWEDCEAWLQQLHEDFGVLVSVQVQLEGLHAGLQPVVRVVGKRHRSGHQFDVVFEDYKPFRLRAVGEVEKHVLQMLSMALLTLENDQAAAERQHNLWTLLA